MPPSSPKQPKAALDSQADPAAPPPAARPKSATGTQAIERAILLIKLLATRGRFGWGLTEISRRSGLDKATVRRILGCLESERLVDRDFRDQRYFPGPLLAELGLSVFGYAPFISAGLAAIARLSKRTGGTSFMYLRSGTDFVVAGRVEEYHHRGMLNEVGFRRPLVSSAGGVAILIAMPEAERERIMQLNFEELTRPATHRPERFHSMIARSLEVGYASNLGDVAPGINSFAVAVPDETGAPIASLSLAGEPDRFPESEAPRFVEMLRAEVEELARAAANVFPDRGLPRASSSPET